MIIYTFIMVFKSHTKIKGMYRSKLLLSVMIALLLSVPATAQVNRARSNKALVYRNVRMPFSNETKRYLVEKIPMAKGSRYSYFLVGDMIVGTDKPHYLIATPGGDYLWRGDVPLKLDVSVTDSDMCLPLIAAINDFHNYTKIRFVPYSNQDDFITIRIGDPGQYRSGVSATGRRAGGQEIVIRKGGAKATFIHEMMHALGVIHEHQRPDRDKYIKFNPQNLIDPVLAGDYVIKQGYTTYTPYDYSSVMHYDGAMAKPGTKIFECKNNNVIVPCPVTMGGSKLSYNDMDGLNEMYKNVQFSGAGFTTPGYPIPPTGNDTGDIYIGWDYKDVQMRRSMNGGNRLILVTAENAFRLKVKAPQTINHFNSCVWAYTNYATSDPVLVYTSGTTITESPGWPRTPKKYDTSTHTNIRMPKLPVPFEQLSIELDINEAAWMPGKTNVNPYGRYGRFFPWLEFVKSENGRQAYRVNGKWIDERDMRRGMRDVIKTINRRRIQSDGPMNEPDGFGPGDPR